MDTLREANNYACDLRLLNRHKEVKALMRKMMPVARRVLCEGHDLTFMMRLKYARALHEDDGATLDDLREAVTSIADTERIARRVLGGAHPLTEELEDGLRDARAALSTRESS